MVLERCLCASLSKVEEMHFESSPCFEGPDNWAIEPTRISQVYLKRKEGNGLFKKMGEEEEGQRSAPVLPWMRDPVDVTLCRQLPLRKVPFLNPRLKSALENIEISNLFPVQVAVWQETVGPGNFDRDLCINSPTGSGKTLAYALPIVHKLSTRAVTRLRALVVVPTRDLALQVKQVFDTLALPVGLLVGLAAGQSSLKDEISGLVQVPGYEDDPYVSHGFRSKVDILVATPGRLVDHIGTKATTGFTLEHLYYLPDLPSGLEFKSCTCSRTYPAQTELPLICERKVKPLYLVALLKSLGEEKCIVFTKSVDSTHRLCKLLNCFGDLQIDIKEYSGLQHQRVRSKTLNEFRKGEFQVLVSSDAMTRGMDVEGVRNVINYDMPKYIKTYVHRAGRTARAGQTGRCFTLMSNDEIGRFKKMMKKAEASAFQEHYVSSSLVEALTSTYQSVKGRIAPVGSKQTSKVLEEFCGYHVLVTLEK
ncbi:hypothetical protein Fmac_002222 [Flemingia macrophylla]|uniref:ATP-dependent RNA helicase n=1 Tax=Flemingia macrophylla TaxID=520843 RepID=A0ABD1NJB1_9FABA